LNLDNLCFWENVVASAELATHLGFPISHIPLQPFGCDVAWLLERDDSDVLAKHLFLAILSDLDTMRAGLEKERQAGS